MKYLIASDIHGSYYYGQKIIDAFHHQQCEKMIFLGDILYHGPRNDLPKGHNPKALVNLLNEYKNKIVSVKGNCDCDVDQMVLQFPIMAPYIIMIVHNRNIFFTHGDIYNNDHLLPMNPEDIMVCGHIHIQKKEVYPTHTYLNCGSIAIPKGDGYHGYMTLDTEKNLFCWYDEDDNLKDTFEI